MERMARHFLALAKNPARLQASIAQQWSAHTSSMFAEAKSPDDYISMGCTVGSIDLSCWTCHHQLPTPPQVCLLTFGVSHWSQAVLPAPVVLLTCGQ
jgi:hypothetical protein